MPSPTQLSRSGRPALPPLLARSSIMSWMRRLSKMPKPSRRALLESLSPNEKAMAAWWATSLRTHTTGKGLLPEGDWLAALWRTGRGFGKTRLLSEHTLAVARWPHLCRGRIALVSKTKADVRDTLVLGESGIMACAEFYREKVIYKPSRGTLEWPRTGVMAWTYSDEAPGRLRGPQHGFACCDEIQEWEPLTWDNLVFGLRLGPWPHLVGALTPKTTPLVLGLHKDPAVKWTHGSMYENRRNLPDRFVAKIENRYGGTRIGRAEIDGDLLVDHGGALWTHAMIEGQRVRPEGVPPILRKVIAVDPSGSDPLDKRDDEDEGAETGIVAAGIDYRDPPHVYVFHDYTVGPEAGPAEWGNRVATAYRIEKADRVVGEVNYGGRLVEANLRAVDKAIPFTAVWAKEGKRLRAEPVAALYEQGRVHHVGVMRELEDQQTTWVPGMKSPDRLDALVHAITELALKDLDDDEPGPLSAYTGRTA